MPVIKVNATKDYTVMSNNHLRNKNMSLKAKGLLSLMLSLPEKWDYSINGLVAICKENKSAVKAILSELKGLGYLTVTKKNPNETTTGRFEYEYNIYEEPQEKQEVKKQGVEILPIEILPLENQPQLNTNISNTKKSNTKDKKKESKGSFGEILNAYTSDESTLELLGEWLKVRKAKRAAMTDTAIQLNINKLDRLAKESGMDVNTYLQEVICRGWQAFYVINNYGNNNRISAGKSNVKIDPMGIAYLDEPSELDDLF